MIVRESELNSDISRRTGAFTLRYTSRNTIMFCRPTKIVYAGNLMGERAKRNTGRLEILLAYSAVEGHARHSNLHNVGRFSWFMKSFGTSKAPQRKIFHTDLNSASSCEKANFWRRTTQTDIWGQRGPGKAFFDPFEGLQNIWTVFFWLFRLIIGATDIKCVWEIFWTFKPAAARNVKQNIRKVRQFSVFESSLKLSGDHNLTSFRKQLEWPICQKILANWPLWEIFQRLSNINRFGPQKLTANPSILRIYNRLRLSFTVFRFKYNVTPTGWTRISQTFRISDPISCQMKPSARFWFPKVRFVYIFPVLSRKSTSWLVFTGSMDIRRW